MALFILYFEVVAVKDRWILCKMGGEATSVSMFLSHSDLFHFSHCITLIFSVFIQWHDIMCSVQKKKLNPSDYTNK